MILKNISILYGKDLKFIESTNVKISNKKFQRINKKINSSKEKILDCKGLLLIPGLINSHTHIGDSIGKDISLDSNVDSRIHPVSGIKQKILAETPKKELARFMRKSAISMLKKGITTFVDFREGGIEGIQLLKDAIKGNPIRSIILGRIDYYQTKSEIKKNTPMPQSYKTELKLNETHNKHSEKIETLEKNLKEKKALLANRLRLRVSRGASVATTIMQEPSGDSFNWSWR